MRLAKVEFLKKKLAKRYGIIGRVAGRYVEAGYSVEISHNTKSGVIDVVARKGGSILAITVIHGSVKVSPSHVEGAARRAKHLGAKPVLVLYGRGPKVTQEAVDKAAELGVELKRVRM